MNPLKSIVTLLVLSVSFTFGFYITDPYTGGKNSFWTAGQSATIKWQTSSVDPNSCKSLIIDLMYGKSELGRAIRNIANRISPTTDSYTWPVHADLPTSDQYFIRIVCLKDTPGMFFSSRFTINGPSTDTSYLVPSTFVSGTADDPNVCPECQGRLFSSSNKISILSVLFLFCSVVSGILLLL